jgi:hypothetical protein
MLDVNKLLRSYPTISRDVICTVWKRKKGNYNATASELSLLMAQLHRQRKPARRGGAAVRGALSGSSSARRAVDDQRVRPRVPKTKSAKPAGIGLLMSKLSRYLVCLLLLN